jgi:hypothetical protein
MTDKTCNPSCRTCGRPLEVTEKPMGFIRSRASGEWVPVSGACAACPEHPSEPPRWRRRYTAPRLNRIGSVRELTLGGHASQFIK